MNYSYNEVKLFYFNKNTRGQERKTDLYWANNCVLIDRY